MEPVPIITNVVRLNPVHCYVIQFVSNLRHVTSPDTLSSCTNKIDCHDITEIFLKWALNTITYPKYFTDIDGYEMLLEALGIYPYH